MKTKPDDSSSGTSTGDLNPTTIFDLLAHDHRRYTLHYLSQKVGAVSLGDLAEQIAIWEADPTYDYYERVLTGLHHTHLPKLAGAGVVCYDVERETVEALDAVDCLTPHLTLTAAADLQ
ncbi:hypothetical protein HUG10_17380 [Halorarum halophilum]|uniref:DUF7344 domain-containing protein n=1 Tax=Halorarum halophilum TaxID=2743090 RepID=A0A7D5GDR6_9EURY|nr:hypothetical protein [Halobaculum halophilum]QLG29192.1 hypothetical protein HUG10_17380 [Halobaculum halophilum]